MGYTGLIVPMILVFCFVEVESFGDMQGFDSCSNFVIDISIMSCIVYVWV